MLAKAVLLLMCADEVPGLTLGQDTDCHNRVFIIFLTAQASVINAMTTFFSGSLCSRHTFPCCIV